MLNPDYKLDTADLKNLKDNLFAGKCIITIQSTETMKHYTYKIKKSRQPDKNIHFVYVLADKDKYIYFATIFDEKALATTKNSKMNKDSVCFKAFRFFYNNLLAGNIDNLNKLNIFHSGHCNKCGKLLTTPESIKRGLGPYCANHK
jgi:hypothetical protein